MRQDLLRGSYLQADETTVPVQMHDKRGADRQAYLWQYGKPGGCSNFSWAADARVHASSWVSGKGFCKPTDIRPTTMLAERSWYTWAVGRTRAASWSMP